MLSEADREKAVELLLSAERDHKLAAQPSTLWPDIRIEDSYAISRLLTERKVKEGARHIGYKIGLTSKAMQQSLQVNEPDYGPLLDYMMISDGAKVPLANYFAPRVEPELTFVLKEPLAGPGITATDVLRATEWLVPSMEIVDSRVQTPRKITDVVADSGSSAGIVLGGRPIKPIDIDLRWAGAIVYRNSEIEETGLAAICLGSPARSVAWLANKVGSEGGALAPGMMILSGSFTRPVAASKGDTVHADFGPLGGVAVQFV